MKKQLQKGSGESFTEQQKSTDDAINQRVKSEHGKGKIAPDEANDAANRDRKSDTASKKTGGGKQKNPGM